MFIVFEGQEGSGKTTQSSLACNYIQELGHKVIHTREPGGSQLGEIIRSILLGNNGIEDPLTELFLISAARTNHIETIIKPALERGAFVVCDRFYGSSIAYQVHGKNLDIAIARPIIDISLCTIMPDTTILLDITYETSQKRIAERKQESLNHYDIQKIDMFNRIRNGFIETAKSENWYIIDANQSLKYITNLVIEILSKSIT